MPSNQGPELATHTLGIMMYNHWLDRLYTVLTSFQGIISVKKREGKRKKEGKKERKKDPTNNDFLHSQRCQMEPGGNPGLQLCCRAAARVL